MLEEQARRLESFCDRRAGQHLRGVFVYRDDDVETVYARDDVRAAYTDGGFQALGRAAGRVQAVGQRVAAADPAMGDVEAHLHAFEDAFVLQFPLADDAGIVVSFDPEAGSRLAGFIDDCLAQLEP